MPYKFSQIDAEDDDVVELLVELHTLTFDDEAPLPEWDKGWWWVGWDQRAAQAAAFCGVVPSSLGHGYAYLKRAGVITDHHGNGLQRRMIRLRERKARSEGFHTMVTDTTDNWRSANNLIAQGYKLWAPSSPWAFPNTLYWKKPL